MGLRVSTPYPVTQPGPRPPFRVDCLRGMPHAPFSHDRPACPYVGNRDVVSGIRVSGRKMAAGGNVSSSGVARDLGIV